VIGAGTVISPLIKVIVTVAVLAGIYFFVVRPILDTTEDISGNVHNQIRRSQQQSNQASRAQDLEFSRSRAASFAQGLLAGSQPWPEASRAVLDCVKKAGASVQAMKRCEKLGETITSKVLSDRNFATSYADNLETQGNAADAAKVRGCIDHAGYDPARMRGCRNLADQLLF